MCIKPIGVQPPKLSYPFNDLLALVKEMEWGLILHVFLEREFRARKQTNRNAWLSDSSETTGDRPAELGRHQLVTNLCGSGCDKIQTVVTHRWCSSLAYSRNAPHLARTGCNAPGESVGLRHSRVGEDAQADIPRISAVKLRFLRSRRNTIGRSSSPYRPHRSLPRVALVRTYSPDACALSAECWNIEQVQVAWNRKRPQVRHSFSIRVRWRYSAAKLDGHRSISPNTMSSEPMIAETSASMCPRVRKSIACKCANEGARILHLYGRLVPSAMR
jgi:hypothetical protein